MEVVKLIEIDMAKYGMDGLIVMSKPSFRRIIQYNNDVGKYAKMTLNDGSSDGVTKVDTLQLGYLDIAGKMRYIRKAPFTISLESFMTYCDKMDEQQFGSAMELWNEICENVKKLEETSSPLEHSETPGTTSSE